jgi:hypothetical protein
MVEGLKNDGSCDKYCTEFTTENREERNGVAKGSEPILWQAVGDCLRSKSPHNYFRFYKYYSTSSSSRGSQYYKEEILPTNVSVGCEIVLKILSQLQTVSQRMPWHPLRHSLQLR